MGDLRCDFSKGNAKTHLNTNSFTFIHDIKICFVAPTNDDSCGQCDEVVVQRFRYKRKRS